MRGADDRDAVLGVELLEEVDNLGAGLGVEVAGGFVGEDDGRRVGEGAGHGDALALSAGELEGLVVDAVAEADLFEDGDAALFGLIRGDALEGHREGDVLEGGHDLDEVEGLEDVADAVAAEPGLLRLGHVENRLTLEEDAALGGLVKRADLVEKGRRARAGRHRPRRDTR